MKIAPSILSADFARLGEAVAIAEKGKAEYLHLDVMDGHFVPAITFGPKLIADLKKMCTLPFDVHLMIETPDKYIDDFVKAGADILSIHAEASIHLHRSIQHIKKLGIQCGVAINPSTPLSAVEYVLPDIDLLLIMTVNPGFGGQTFIPQMITKIQQARTLIDKFYPHIQIEVDGGINIDTIRLAAQAGVDIAVAGFAVFGSPDPIIAMRNLRVASE